MNRSPPQPHPARRLAMPAALRLLLLGLMGLALASRLAIGAIAPADGAAEPSDTLAKLRAATILCGDRAAPSPAVPMPRRKPVPPGDLLLLSDQADNSHALTSEPALPAPTASATRPLHPSTPPRATPPRAWRVAVQARAPPIRVRRARPA